MTATALEHHHRPRGEDFRLDERLQSLAGLPPKRRADPPGPGRKRSPARPRRRTAAATSSTSTRVEDCRCSAATFARNTATASRARSTLTSEAAPRDSASMPRAPVPANRSSTAAPSRSPSRANRDSRTRSAVGRSPLRGARSRRPANRPPVTRRLNPLPLFRVAASRTTPAGHRPPRVAYEIETLPIRMIVLGYGSITQNAGAKTNSCATRFYRPVGDAMPHLRVSCTSARSFHRSPSSRSLLPTSPGRVTQARCRISLRKNGRFRLAETVLRPYTAATLGRRENCA